MIFDRKKKKTKKRVFVLGLDGAVKPLIDRPEELPNLQRVLQQGCYRDLVSRPAITSIAWTSMVSGVNAGKHGIFGFRVGDQLNFSTEKKAPELWDYLPTISLNIPMTFPVRPIDGVMISGMMTPELGEQSVYPAKEIDFLQETGFVFEPQIEEEKEATLKNIHNSIEAKIKTIQHYLTYDWQLFFVVFREFDVVQHFYWGEDLPYYQRVDKFLGRLMDEEKLFDNNTSLLVVSDHGFSNVDKTFDLEEWVNQQGYSEIAQVGGWGSLYIQDTNRVPEILKQLEAVTHEGNPVLDVYPREEIYWGPYAAEGPAIVVSPRRDHGFTFGMRTGQIIAKADHKTGCHLEEGVFAAYGDNIAGLTDLGRQAQVYDVFPTVLKLTDHKIPEDIDGKNLLRVL